MHWGSLVAQLVKNLPEMQETWVQLLGWKDPPEKEIATHSSSNWPEEFYGQRSQAGYSPWDGKELDTTVQLPFFIYYYV